MFNQTVPTNPDRGDGPRERAHCLGCAQQRRPGRDHPNTRNRLTSEQLDRMAYASNGPRSSITSGRTVFVDGGNDCLFQDRNSRCLTFGGPHRLTNSTGRLPGASLFAPLEATSLLVWHQSPWLHPANRPGSYRPPFPTCLTDDGDDEPANPHLLFLNWNSATHRPVLPSRTHCCRIGGCGVARRGRHGVFATGII